MTDIGPAIYRKAQQAIMDAADEWITLAGLSARTGLSMGRLILTMKRLEYRGILECRFEPKTNKDGECSAQTASRRKQWRRRADESVMTGREVMG